MDISPLGLMVEKALWMRCFTVQYRQQPISRTMPGLQQSKGGSADFQTVKLLLNQFCLTMLQAVLHKKSNHPKIADFPTTFELHNFAAKKSCSI